jgi:hypothetical protein
LLRDRLPLNLRELIERRKSKRLDFIRMLLRLTDRDNLRCTESKERKKVRESEWKEKLLLPNMRSESKPNDWKESKDLMLPDRKPSDSRLKEKKSWRCTDLREKRNWMRLDSPKNMLELRCNKESKLSVSKERREPRNTEQTKRESDWNSKLEWKLREKIVRPKLKPIVWSKSAKPKHTD